MGSYGTGNSCIFRFRTVTQIHNTLLKSPWIVRLERSTGVITFSHSLHIYQSMIRSDRNHVKVNAPYLPTASRFPLPKTAFIAQDNHNIISPVPLLIVSFVPVSTVRRFRSVWIVIILPLSSRSQHSTWKVKQARSTSRYRSTVIPAYIVAYARFSFPVSCTTEAQHRFVASAKGLELSGRVYFLWYRPKERVWGSDWCAGEEKSAV